MPKFTRFSKSFAACMLAAMAACPAAHADRILNEDFDYAAETQLYTSGLEQQVTPWLSAMSGHVATNPIKVSAGSLTYEGYSDGVGGKVSLSSDASSQKLMCPFNDGVKALSANGQTLYVSFLLNVQDVGEKGDGNKAFFFSIVPETSKGVNDNPSSEPNGYMRLYCLNGSETGKFKLGFSRGGASSKVGTNVSEDLNLNETYLVVMSYKTLEGTTNDEIKMWINPAIQQDAPAATVTQDDATTGELSFASGGVKYVQLRQGATSSNNGPELIFDALRVGTEWTDVIEVPEAPVNTPEIILSENSFEFDTMPAGDSYTFTTHVSGNNIVDNITFSLPSDITASVEAITPEQAEEGVDVTFTVTPTAENDSYDHVITVTSGEAMFREIHVTGYVFGVVNVPNSQAVFTTAEDPEAAAYYYRYTGKAVVTAIEEGEFYGTPGYEIYAQDMFGGIKFDTYYTSLGAETGECPIHVGDEISNFLFFMEDPNPEAPVMNLLQYADEMKYDITATGKTKTPVEINLADVTPSTASSYLYKLVTVNNVNFELAYENQVYSSAQSVKFTDGDEHSAYARPFATSTGLIGAPVPATGVSLTGVAEMVKPMMQKAQFTLMLRSADDVVLGAPSLEVAAPEKLMDFTANAAPVGESTQVMKFTVTAENLTAAAPIEFGGVDAALFSANLTEIPAGTGTYEVIVSYAPTAVGRHKANFMINADAINSEFNYSKAIDAKAYDPENLPTITIDPAAVTLEAKPGETATATVTLNASGCFDYIQGKRLGTGSGITINNTYLLPDSQDVELTITFAPQEEGEYSETFEYTTTLCSSPATITVTAYCDGERIPEELQGDTFDKVSWETPVPFYAHDFMGHEHNKPLSHADWTNVAEAGTRAWWGYQNNDEDGFHAAKATAYDSTLRPAKAEDAQMILISPALDYKNAADTKLTFELMGQFLSEDQEAALDILFGEVNEAGELVFYPMSGFNVPVTSDEANTWIPYEVDMSTVEDMPDTFFIAYRLTAKRSQATSATYYVKNFIWNPTQQVVESVNGIDGGRLYDVYNMQGLRILSGADAPRVKALPAGLYIINGKKVILK